MLQSLTRVLSQGGSAGSNPLSSTSFPGQRLTGVRRPGIEDHLSLRCHWDWASASDTGCLQTAFPAVPVRCPLQVMTGFFKDVGYIMRPGPEPWVCPIGRSAGWLPGEAQMQPPASVTIGPVWTG